ncbi:hypothetical protein ACVILL_002682 [Bradyrhizobium sp. USDA 3364]
MVWWGEPVPAIRATRQNAAGLSPPEGRNVKQKAGHFGLVAGGIEPRAEAGLPKWE